MDCSFMYSLPTCIVFTFSCIRYHSTLSCIGIFRFFLPLGRCVVQFANRKFFFSSVFAFGTRLLADFVCWSRRSVRRKFSHFLIEFFVKNSSHASDFGTFVTLQLSARFHAILWLGESVWHAMRSVTATSKKRIETRSNDERGGRKKFREINFICSVKIIHILNAVYKLILDDASKKERKKWNTTCTSSNNVKNFYASRSSPKYHFSIRKSRLLMLVSKLT